MNKNIKPTRKKCGCGNRVTHHHILCNKCWDKKEQQKVFIELKGGKKQDE